MPELDTVNSILEDYPAGESIPAFDERPATRTVNEALLEPTVSQQTRDLINVVRQTNESDLEQQYTQILPRDETRQLLSMQSLPPMPEFMTEYLELMKAQNERFFKGRHQVYNVN